MYIISAVVDQNQSKVALCDSTYRLLQKKTGAVADLSKLCQELITEGKIALSDVAYAGVAVDAAAGTPDAIAAELGKAIGIKCLGTSLMGAKALGKAYAKDDVDSLFLLKIEDTVDCGVVIDKKLYAGTHLRGGNVAHTVISSGGFECACGNRGCFQAYACNAGLRRIAAEAGVEGAETLTHKALFDMNTPSAEQAKETYVKYLAGGITNLINLFQLREFVIEGSLVEAGDKLMKPMMDIIMREQFTHNMPNKCTVSFSENAEDTALIGAALLGR